MFSFLADSSIPGSEVSQTFTTRSLSVRGLGMLSSSKVVRRPLGLVFPWLDALSGRHL